jgi:hypothetical protein
MKMSPELTKAQANMQPGVITSDGFLGDDDRPIVDIIQDDEEEMARLGLSFEESAKKLRELMEEGRKGLGEPVTVERQWLVRVDEARGFLPSPFEDGIFRKVNAQVERLDESGKPTGDRVAYTQLSLHLMEKHHFLQGKGSPFRLNPGDIKRTLGI